MKKIAVVVDSATSYSKEYITNLGLYYLPLHIIFNDQEDYLEGINISTSDVYDRMKKKEYPTTSQPSIGELCDLFNSLQKEGYDAAVVVTLGSGISGTAANVRMAADEAEFEVLVVDSKSAAYTQLYLAKTALKFVNEGVLLEEIQGKLDPIINESFVYIVPDDLGHLKRGGRLTPSAALLGGLLKIKPILQLDVAIGGKIDVVTKVRTMSKATDTMIEMMADKITDVNDYCYTVAHAGSITDGQQLKQKLLNRFPTVEVELIELTAVLGAHTGVGLLGLMATRKAV